MEVPIKTSSPSCPKHHKQPLYVVRCRSCIRDTKPRKFNPKLKNPPKTTHTKVVIKTFLGKINHQS